MGILSPLGAQCGANVECRARRRAGVLVRLLRGGKEERGPLTTSELGQLRQQLEAFVAHPGADAPLTLTSVLTIKAGALPAVPRTWQVVRVKVS